MPYGYGWGFGFRGASPPWPYVGRGRGGLPRCGYFLGQAAPAGGWGWRGDYPFHGPPPYPGPITREEELDFLKGQAQAIKRKLEEIEARMEELEKEKE